MKVTLSNRLTSLQNEGGNLHIVYLRYFGDCIPKRILVFPTGEHQLKSKVNLFLLDVFLRGEGLYYCPCLGQLPEHLKAAHRCPGGFSTYHRFYLVDILSLLKRRSQSLSGLFVLGQCRLYRASDISLCQGSFTSSGESAQPSISLPNSQQRTFVL